LAALEVVLYHAIIARRASIKNLRIGRLCRLQRHHHVALLAVHKPQGVPAQRSSAWGFPACRSAGSPPPQPLAASLPPRSAESWAMANVRLIKHEAVPNCGSFEVLFRTAGRRSISIGTICPAAGSGRTWSTVSKPWSKPRQFARAERDRLTTVRPCRTTRDLEVLVGGAHPRVADDCHDPPPLSH
jgi:hypothetical protein